MNMKKAISLLLTATMGLGMVACTGPKADVDKGSVQRWTSRPAVILPLPEATITSKLWKLNLTGLTSTIRMWNSCLRRLMIITT